MKLYNLRYDDGAAKLAKRNFGLIYNCGTGNVFFLLESSVLLSYTLCQLSLRLQFFLPVFIRGIARLILPKCASLFSRPLNISSNVVYTAHPLTPESHPPNLYEISCAQRLYSCNADTAPVRFRVTSLLYHVSLYHKETNATATYAV